MAVSFPVLREALWHLSLEPHHQREELAGMVVPDELALDLANAVDSLEHAQETAGIRLASSLVGEVRRLCDMLDVSPGDPLWDDRSLDRHPTWAEARRVARDLLELLPSA